MYYVVNKKKVLTGVCILMALLLIYGTGEEQIEITVDQIVSFVQEGQQ